MGVKGLWHILAPGGRRIKLESLEGKILAIDASIWVVQFIYAIKQGKIGNSSSSAHLHGFMKRICKLLYFGIRPVFVFDGKTPSLKSKTLKKRKRMQLQQEKVDFKKAAERIVKKYLDQELRNLKDKEKSGTHLEYDDKKTQQITQQQQEIKDTISRLAQDAAEQEILDQKQQEEDYDNELIKTLIIEYGLLLQQ